MHLTEIRLASLRKRRPSRSSRGLSATPASGRSHTIARIAFVLPPYPFNGIERHLRRFPSAPGYALANTGPTICLNFKRSYDRAFRVFEAVRVRVRNAPFSFPNTFGSILSASNFVAETKVRRVLSVSYFVSYRSNAALLSILRGVGHVVCRKYTPGIPGKRFDQTYDGAILNRYRPFEPAYSYGVGRLGRDVLHAKKSRTFEVDGNWF